MKTRTLLLLAVGVGLVILVAGSLQFLRLADETERAAARPALALGDTGRAADLEATVLSAEEEDGVMRVVVRIGGVDDPLGLEGFRLYVPEPLAPDALDSGSSVSGSSPGGSAPTPCTTVTRAEQTCALEFTTSAATAATRVLRLTRGEDRVDWRLVG